MIVTGVPGWNSGLKRVRVPGIGSQWVPRSHVKDGAYCPPVPPPRSAPLCECGKLGRFYVCDNAMERRGHWECEDCSNVKVEARDH